MRIFDGNGFCQVSDSDDESEHEMPQMYISENYLNGILMQLDEF